MRLGVYLYATGSSDAGLAAFERAVELGRGAALGGARVCARGVRRAGCMMASRYGESSRSASRRSRSPGVTGAGQAELRALTVLGSDLAYLGRGDGGPRPVPSGHAARRGIGDPMALQRAYITLTDVLTMLGRPRESARLGQTGLEVVRRYGIDAPCSLEPDRGAARDRRLG